MQLMASPANWNGVEKQQSGTRTNVQISTREKAHCTNKRLRATNELFPILSIVEKCTQQREGRLAPECIACVRFSLGTFFPLSSAARVSEPIGARSCTIYVAHNYNLYRYVRSHADAGGGCRVENDVAGRQCVCVCVRMEFYAYDQNTPSFVRPIR